MRITNNMLTTAFMQNLRRNLGNLDDTQRQLSSGKAISRPSDDPVRLQQILKLDTAIDQHKQYIRNMDGAEAWLTATDAALAQAGGVLLKAQELAVKGANGTNDASAMSAIADEVRQLTEQLIGVANANHAGRYIFAGTNTTEKPYTEAVDWNDPATTYTGFSGNAQHINYEIAPDVTINVNTPGTQAFGSNDATGTIDVLRRLEIALRDGNTQQVNDAIGELQQANDKLLTARSDAGARSNRLEATKMRYEEDIISMEALKSKSEDADYAEVVMHLKSQESVYRASLAAGARIIQPSLIDFLR